MKNWLVKYYKVILMILLILGIAVIFYVNGEYVLKLPFQETVVSDITDVCLDEEGRIYILDNSGYDLVCIGQDGQVVYRISEGNDRGSGFVQGKDVLVDKDQNVFVHNRVASEDAYAWIGSESILEFDKNGNFVDEYVAREYSIPKLKTTILKLALVDGEVCYFYTNYNNLRLATVRDELIHDIVYPGASEMVASAAFDSANDIIYIVSLDGKIKKYEDKQYISMYEASSEVSRSIPRDISVDADGNVFIADLGFRGIYTFEDDNYVPYVCNDTVVSSDYQADEEEIIDFFVPYKVNAEYGVIYNDIDQIGIVANGYVKLMDTYTENIITNISIILVMLAEIVTVILLLVGAFKLLTFVIKTENGTIRIIAAVIVGFAVMTGVFSALAMKDFNQRLINEMFERQTLAATLVNQLLPKEDFKELNGVEDFHSEAYMRVKQIVDGVILDEGKTPGDLYLVMYSLEGDELILRYALEEIQGCWYPYVWSDGTDEQDIYDYVQVERFYGEEDSEGSFMLVYAPLTDRDGTVLGVIEVGTDMTVFSEQNKNFLINLFINIFVVAVVVILLILEVVVFAGAKKNYSNSITGDLHKSFVPIPVEMYRIVVFIVFFATNLTTPFLSIYGVQLASEMDQLFGISPEIWAAVPISAEVLFGALFSVFGNKIIRLLGKRNAGILGGIMFTVGLCIRFIMPSLWILTLGNALQGAGWGIVLLIINVEIAERPDEEERERGYTNYNVALQNGMNSGIVAGGFLMVFMNYKGVMIAAAIVSSIVLLFCIAYLDSRKRAAQNEEEKEEKKISLLRFLFSRNVLVYYICIVVPVIAASYYLNYLYPIIAENAGLSENYIGYSYLLNGLVVICLGNVIVNFMSKFFSKKVLILLASIIYTVCFVLVGWSQSIPVLLVVLVLLAVSDSFGYVAQSTFYNDIKEVGEYGYDRAAGVYSLLENFSQTAGSFIFGYILTVGFKDGMMIYGIVILITGFIFVIVAREPKRPKKEGKE